MRLTPPDYMSEEDLWIQDILKTYPVLLHRLTFLINGYRDLLHSCIEEMQEHHLDTADTLISREKKDWTLYRYGIPIFDRTEDWDTIHEALKAVYKQMERDGEEEI